jgi:hypothetical protein
MFKQVVLVAFRSDISVVLYRIIKYKQNTVKHNSTNEFIKVNS